MLMGLATIVFFIWYLDDALCKLVFALIGVEYVTSFFYKPYI